MLQRSLRSRRILRYAACAGALGAIDPSGFAAVRAQRVATGLNLPVYVTHAPADTLRLFVVERRGAIRILHHDAPLAAPFLDLTTVVLSNFSERGLLGLAFHPNYAQNGQFFVNYTSSPNGDTVIARFTVTADPDVADPASEFQILRIAQPAANHNGGWLDFGPDGLLYVALGDGGNQGDPDNRAQSTDALLGKILRIDVNGDDFPADPERNYAIPPTNPFVVGPGADEVWALGLRNPWRCAFDRQTGDLWIGDVGWGQREEVDFQPAEFGGGRNYGWRCLEGTRCTGLSGCTCSDAALAAPIHEYDHNAGAAIVGGYVYRGAAIPELQGAYVFADFAFSRFWSLRYDGTIVSELHERTAEFAPPGDLAIFNPSSFGEDAAGELYVCDYSGGEVFKFVAVPAACAPRGDANCDCAIDFFDIDPFLIALFDAAGYADAQPYCALDRCDLDADGGVNFFDIGPFVECLLNSVCP